eukprot:Gb_38093 [translate_table: standard]
MSSHRQELERFPERQRRARLDKREERLAKERERARRRRARAKLERERLLVGSDEVKETKPTIRHGEGMLKMEGTTFGDEQRFGVNVLNLFTMVLMSIEPCFEEYCHIVDHSCLYLAHYIGSCGQLNVESSDTPSYWGIGVMLGFLLGGDGIYTHKVMYKEVVHT